MQRHTADSWERRTRVWFTALGLPSFGWFALFLLVPIGLLTALSLGWDLGQDWQTTSLNTLTLRKVLEAPYGQITVHTFVLSALATGLCLLLAFPLCLFLWRQKQSRNPWLLGLILAPFLINFIVRVYAWFLLLRPEGLIGHGLLLLGYPHTLISSTEGVLLGLVYGYVPFMILPLWATFSTLDPKLWEAGEDLGARSGTILWRIIWPQCRSGVIAGCLLVFIPMLGEYTIPKMLGGGLIPTLGTSIESQFFSGVRPHWGFGAALSLWLMVIISGLLLCFRKSVGLALRERSKDL